MAGWLPPIVCAKLVGPVPACLDCAFVRPEIPFVGPPKPQPAPVPLPSFLKVISRKAGRFQEYHHVPNFEVFCSLPDLRFSVPPCGGGG